jgi:hypothetical protein
MATARDELLALRGLLAPLAEAFELDPATSPAGLVARIPVVGGRFVHPLSREPITSLRVYGAGGGRVKLLEPRFLRSLALVEVVGLTRPEQFCAQVARLLGEALGELGRLREALVAMGLGLDLDPDMLRLAGRIELAGLTLELRAYRPAGLLVAGLEGRALAGLLSAEERSLALGGDPVEDRAALERLARGLAARVTVAPPIMELTEEVIEEGPEPGPPAPAPRAEGAPPPAESLGPLSLEKLLDLFGPDAQVSAHGGKLRLAAPFRVVQGEFTFYLEQQAPRVFRGLLVSPQGGRYPVEVDLGAVFDLKEIFDRVMLGR